ncbi:hypothetical protein [Aquimarina macrocephali]|uniref:hypothetical protein n=1 Tax=Aquimarina macrocephali TaxID=666563 RepID=UPI000466C894|nr:hypothetical protein [Aquimarina macrocephali]
MSGTELLISFSIIMMMLSFVSERLSNLIKLYYQNKTIFIPYPHKGFKGKFLWGLEAKLKILANRQPTVQSEKQREYRVLVINILVGIAIAIFSNANFFELIKSISTFKGNDNNNINIILGWTIDRFTGDDKWWLLAGAIYILLLLWSLSLILFNQLVETDNKISKRNIKWPFISVIGISIIAYIIILICGDDSKKEVSAIFQHTIGYVITGLFLSLGSKFWHDLLDLLFKYKNVQQHLNQKSTYTDYDNPEQILSLANTSEYEVVDRLMEEYQGKINKIKGVVSIGKNTFLHKRSGLYRKIIEVEFTTPSAQEELYELINEGSVTIDYNTFYLRDYLKPLYTSKLTAVGNDKDLNTTGNWSERIKEVKPICYAHNEKHKSNLGSFRLFKEDDGTIYAESNFHVFASKNDLEQAHKLGGVYEPKDKTVLLFIGDNPHEEATIIEFNFGEGNGTRKDYCKAKLKSNDINILKKYNKVVDYKWLLENENDKMKMFGATTKEISFWKNKSLTYCHIKYKTFYKELWLYKIEARAKHINFGDSGAMLYYYDNDNKLKKGLIVAKSDHYAYMFDLNN